MNFLEELEQDKGSENKTSLEKTPRQLWESCFKYFKHFSSILRKDKDAIYESEFNITDLNLNSKSSISGPFELKRSQDNNHLTLELKFLTELNEVVRIKRKDQRSAEILRVKLLKDSILSSVICDKDNNYFTELNKSIPSFFRLVLKNEKNFYVEYKNCELSSNRSIKISLDNINQPYMDKLAKYILGKNKSLYTESISNDEISKIRDRIAQEKKIKSIRKEKYKAIVEEEKKQEEIRKANTIKEKSKRYIKKKGVDLKSKIVNKFNDLMS